MRRVVVTGIGAVSCIGNNQAEIVDSLRNGRSGIVANESYQEMGLRSQVSGSINIDLADHIDRKVKRFMGDAAAYAYISMQQAIEDAGLEESDVSNVRSGLMAASGGASSENIVQSADKLDDGQYCFGMPGDAVQDQRHQLLDYVCVRYECALYRRKRRADSNG